MERIESVIVLSEEDPVARALHAIWGTGAPELAPVDGAPPRTLAPGVVTLRRATLHIRDDDLDRRLPPELRAQRPTLIFPSVHRSRSGVRCLPVHPIGNPGPDAELGGRPGELVPTSPRLMASALRRLAEGAPADFPATFEATHHGPSVGLPAFFVEVATGDDDRPDPAAVRHLAEVLRDLEPDPGDRVAVGVGGGHYAPRFTDLALRRRWAFGHLLPRHALDAAGPALLARALNATPGAEGFVPARAQDRDAFAARGTARWLRETEAPPRGDPPRFSRGSPGGARSAGT
ncbi:MAG TPA: D-aminoacyl-tRNA deacylase, partial [Thermoplasmata archaeon]|nr:D-aminoacyl-tRNA deacylase [Thermoplasmata archaeon]